MEDADKCWDEDTRGFGVRRGGREDRVDIGYEEVAGQNGCDTNKYPSEDGDWDNAEGLEPSQSYKRM